MVSPPLTLSGVSSTYKILSSDSEATRKTKAYKWIIDTQIASVMPNAKPTPSSSTNLMVSAWAPIFSSTAFRALA